MIVNQSWHSRILFLPIFLGIALSGLFTPAKGMDKYIDPKIISTAITFSPLVLSEFDLGSIASVAAPIAEGALELSSQTMQDYKFGSSPASKSLIDLVCEIMSELDVAGSIIVNKMNPESICMIAQEYQFVGVHPTNGTLYLDEPFLKTKTKDEQKILIKSALKHYMNNSYTKMMSTRFFTAALCGYAAYNGYQWGNGVITGILKDVFSVDLHSNSFFSPTGLLKNAASLLIGATICETTNYILNKTIKNPVTKIFAKRCHKQIQNDLSFSKNERDFLEETRKLCDPDEVKKFFFDVQKRIQNVDPKQALQLAFQLGGEVAKYEKFNPELKIKIQDLIDNLMDKHNNTIAGN